MRASPWKVRLLPIKPKIIAKLSSNPPQLWSDLVTFSLNPPTHMNNHPTYQKVSGHITVSIKDKSLDLSE